MTSEQFAIRAEDWERFFEMSLDLFAVAGFDGRFKRVNAAWERTLGWTEAELTSRPWIDFVHPDDRQATIDEGAKLAAGQTLISFENRYRGKDGSFRRLLWKARPMPDLGVSFATARDISENTALRDAHRRVLRELATPVIRVHKSILLVPLVGALEPDRAAHVTETVLTRVVDEAAKVLILDVAGVPHMDTSVADALLKMAAAVRLLGAETVLTGIGASAAKTMIQLGIDLSQLHTTNQLSEGIEVALGLIGKSISSPRSSK